ncbi:MAG TPA: formyltransferase family protein [Gaiellaceae bacterium]|nr:formyltransferase family protein [Gaiellaceae bacterium]
MRIVFLTTADPIYLPAFFDRVLRERARDTAAVYLVPPLYKNQTTAKAAWRYFRTFGFEGLLGLATRTVRAKARGDSIAAACKLHGVRCAETSDVNAPSFLEEVGALGTDVIVSVSCPQIFHTPLIQLPAKACLNVHGSILPQYRGIMPSFWMLANSEETAGVSVYLVNEEIDAGDLCGQQTFKIDADETLDAFLHRSKAVAAELLLQVLDRVEQGDIETSPLDLSTGSYFSWPDREAVRRFRAAGRRLW